MKGTVPLSIVRTMGLTRFTNGRVVRGDDLVAGDVWCRDGVVVCPETLFWAAASSDALVHETVDCGGCIVSPGLVDLQINGCFGVDFADPRLERSALDRAAAGVLAHGCTALCPTLVSSPRELYAALIPKYAAWASAPPPEPRVARAAVLGLHLEGPFLNESKKGAHLASSIPGACVWEDVEARYGADFAGVRIVTLAPELDGAPATIAQLTARGVTVSLGHTQATKADGLRGVRAGANLLTHLYNAMPSFHHRDPGLVGLLGVADEDRPYFSIIADGIHADPASVAIAHRAHPRGAVLVTDAMAAMGLGDGTHGLGAGVSVVVRGKSATVEGTSTLAGAVVSLDECVRCYAKFTGCGAAGALSAASAHPAAVLGDATRGHLGVGARADLALFDDDLTPRATYVAGARAWGSP